MTATPRPFRIFLDSADTSMWSGPLATGVFHGVTTNPLLLERAGLACTMSVLADLSKRAREEGAREIHLQAWGEDSDTLAGRGAELAALADGIEVAVKVPATGAGFRAARRLVEQGARVTVTAVYGPGQVLAAAALGAHYAAPYLGRLNDAGQDGSAILLTMGEILKGRDTTLRLLAASLRRVEDVVDLAAAGLDTFTVGSEVASALLRNPLTDTAAADFERAAGS